MKPMLVSIAESGTLAHPCAKAAARVGRVWLSPWTLSIRKSDIVAQLSKLKARSEETGYWPGKLTPIWEVKTRTRLRLGEASDKRFEEASNMSLNFASYGHAEEQTTATRRRPS